MRCAVEQPMVQCSGGGEQLFGKAMTVAAAGCTGAAAQRPVAKRRPPPRSPATRSRYVGTHFAQPLDLPLFCVNLSASAPV